MSVIFIIEIILIIIVSNDSDNNTVGKTIQIQRLVSEDDAVQILKKKNRQMIEHENIQQQKLVNL